MHFWGYERDDGTIGVRNHVAVIAAQGNANTVANGIAALVNGVMPVVHPYGRGQIGPDDLQQTKTLAGTILNPNIYAVVLVCMEPKSAEKVITEVRKKSQKIVEVVTIQKAGTFKAIESGARIAAKLVIEASKMKRIEASIDQLTIAVNCGASDATSGITANPVTGKVCDKVIEMGGTVIFNETVEIMGAEHILAERSGPDVGNKLLEKVKEIEDYVLGLGIDITGNQPKPDNIAGGITTAEEKALGNIAKVGKNPIKDIISYSEIPPERGALYHMYSSPAGAESNTGFYACGAQIIIFTTGKGNPVGHAVGPVIKVTGNPQTVELLNEHIDVDVSKMLTASLGVNEAADMLFDAMISVASGKKTCSEVIKHNEFAISRIGLTV